MERNNPLRNNPKKIEEYKAFFNLPEKVGIEGRKPVFYIQLGGRCYFGFTPRLRVFYDKTVADGIGKEHIAGKTDYVKAIFGYTSSGSSSKIDTDKEIPNSRKTRVSFSDAVQIRRVKGISERYLTLSEPRPTDYLNYYLEQSRGKTSYNSTDMKLRGAKQYWLHREADPGVKEGRQNKNLDSLMNPLDKGSCFRGTIRFKNLRSYELGLLIWSIRLEKDSWMNVGKGKAYGYGAIKVSLQSVRVLDYKNAYGLPAFCDAKDEKKNGCVESAVSGLFGDIYRELSVDELINGYKAHVQKENGNRDIMTMPLIKDFFAMKDSTSIPDEKMTGYMTLKQFQNQTKYKTPLPKPMDVI